MSNQYIRFKCPQSGKAFTPGNIGKKLVQTGLSTIIPLANPDFDNKMDVVVFWLIEFENDSYYPNREIGLDINENPIMIMPWGKNYGYWTDNNLVMKDFRSHFEVIDIPKAIFEKYWTQFETDH